MRSPKPKQSVIGGETQDLTKRVWISLLGLGSPMARLRSWMKMGASVLKSFFLKDKTTRVQLNTRTLG